jgi:dGTPase
VVEELENNGRGLNLTWEVRDGIVNHTGKHLASTLEGVIVKFADRIAYINHDIDDACRAGILRQEEIPADLRAILGETHSARINTMVVSVVLASTDRAEIRMEPHVQAATDELRSFLFSHVYTNSTAKAEDGKAKGILAALYERFVSHPEKMPKFYFDRCESNGVERTVCDFISGMTDRYAIELYKELYIPKVWKT